jgi:transposase, IS30 family
MSQLTEEQRYAIMCLKSTGVKQVEIALIIGKDKSVISRELRRNCDKRDGSYRSELAQKKCAERHSTKTKKHYFTYEIERFIIVWIRKFYSPEQIVGKAKKLKMPFVSAERIYQYIWNDKRRGGDLHEGLRTCGKRYRKRGAAKDRRGIIKGRVDIDNRPPEVEERLRFGDLEIDTIIGADHKGAIVTVNDRASGVLLMEKLNGKDALELAHTVIILLMPWKGKIRTITSDNGKEFAEHDMISKALGLDFYFAHPYHSWERGSNENLNGLVRQYIPKKTNFNNITKEYVKYVENELNHRPRKRFNFDTPNDIFNQFNKN